MGSRGALSGGNKRQVLIQSFEVEGQDHEFIRSLNEKTNRRNFANLSNKPTDSNRDIISQCIRFSNPELRALQVKAAKRSRLRTCRRSSPFIDKEEVARIIHVEGRLDRHIKNTINDAGLSPSDFEDFRQDVYLKVLSSKRPISAKDWIGWAKTTIRNMAYTRQRKEVVQRKALKNIGLPDPEIEARDSQAEEKQFELWRRVRNAIRKEHPDLYSVMMARASKKTIREIAKVLGCSEGRVRYDRERQTKATAKMLARFREDDLS